MPYRKPTADELAASRDNRFSQYALERKEHYVNLIRHARSLVDGADNPVAAASLDQLVIAGRNETNHIRQKCGGRIVKRKRPENKQNKKKSCTVYLDECGNHYLKAPDTFRAFVLAGLIVWDDDKAQIDDAWRGFKADKLGTPDYIVHEPDVRYWNGPFGNENTRDDVLEAMRATYEQQEMCVVSVVIQRDDYLKEHGTEPPDMSLKGHTYWTALDFLLERVVMVLDMAFDGAPARLVVEQRGPKEDAELQYEFARLQLDGTSYIAPGWFRQSLHPGVHFESKVANVSGLQLADLTARPVGAAVLGIQDNYLWPEVQAKLCPLVDTKHSILGLKVYPWDDRYGELCIAKRATEVALTAGSE